MTSAPFQIPAGLEHLLPMFQREMQADLARLMALLPEPSDQLAEHLHAMRGKCGLFGEDVLFELLLTLDHGNASNPEKLLLQIQDRVRLICQMEGSGT